MGVLIGNGEFMQTSQGACSNNYRRLGTKMGAMGYKGINKVILGEKSKNVQYHSPQLSISKSLMDSVRCGFFFFFFFSLRNVKCGFKLAMLII